jgi:hypothetical protein
MRLLLAKLISVMLFNQVPHTRNTAMQKNVVLFLCVALSTACLMPSSRSLAWAQGSGSSRAAPPRATRPPTPEEFYDSFWRHLVKKDAAYNTWSEFQREKADDAIENPHGTVSKTYANKVAATDPTKLPIGSVLVREDYDSKKKRVSISVMYRVKNYDPAHNDWYWMSFLENGSISRTPEKDGRKPLAGKVTSCIDCHAKAPGKDFVFSESPPKVEKNPSSDKPKAGTEIDSQPSKIKE